MAKKKVKDLTLLECRQICDGREHCEGCPLRRIDTGYLCISNCVLGLKEEFLEREIDL